MVIACLIANSFRVAFTNNVHFSTKMFFRSATLLFSVERNELLLKAQ